MPVDWGRAPYAVTIDPGIEGQPLVTILGINEAQRRVEWTWQQPLDEQDTVVVAGLVSNHDPGTTLQVYAYGAGNDSYQGQPLVGLYALRVLQGEPFQLLALDVTEQESSTATWRTTERWTVVSSEGVAENTALPIDMAPYFDPDGLPRDHGLPVQPGPDFVGDGVVPGLDGILQSIDGQAFLGLVDPIVTSGTVHMPADPDDPLRQGGSADVTITCAVEGVPQDCGWATWVGWDEVRARYAFFARHFVPTRSKRVQTEITAVNGEHGSTVIVPGDPSAWLASPTLLPVPDLVATDVTDVTLHDWAFVLDHEQLPETARPASVGVRPGPPPEDCYPGGMSMLLLALLQPALGAEHLLSPGDLAISSLDGDEVLVWTDWAWECSCQVFDLPAEATAPADVQAVRLMLASSNKR